MYPRDIGTILRQNKFVVTRSSLTFEYILRIKSVNNLILTQKYGDKKLFTKDNTIIVPHFVSISMRKALIVYVSKLYYMFVSDICERIKDRHHREWLRLTQILQEVYDEKARSHAVLENYCDILYIK